MKIFILLALTLIVAVGLKAQTNTSIQKSHYGVSKYLRATLNDPDNYKPVSWSKLEKVKDSVSYHYIIEHKFRAKNGYNATITRTWSFYLDKNFKVYSMYEGTKDEEFQELLNEQNKLMEDSKKLNEKYNVH